MSVFAPVILGLGLQIEELAVKLVLFIAVSVPINRKYLVSFPPEGNSYMATFLPAAVVHRNLMLSTVNGHKPPASSTCFLVIVSLLKGQNVIQFCSANAGLHKKSELTQAIGSSFMFPRLLRAF